jgi:hypothetical protein
MKQLSALPAVAALCALTGASAFAATWTSPPAAGARAASQDFGHLSIDGAHAFQDIALARLAIYDGQPDSAARMITDAQQALTRAKTDDTVFVKAESELTPPKNAPAPASATPPSTQKIAWLPVDGEFVLGETLTPTAANTAAVAQANQHVHNGEPDQARKALKLADVDADFTLAVVPLKQTTTDVDQASMLMGRHDYYGASQALREAQNGVRYESVLLTDNLQKTAKAEPKTARR